jgi:hypothetical protein
LILAVVAAAAFFASQAKAEEWTLSMALPTATEDDQPLTPADMDRADMVCRSPGQTDVAITLRAPLSAVLSVKRDFAAGVWTCLGYVRTGSDQLFSAPSEPYQFTAGAGTPPPPVVIPPPTVRGRPRAPSQFMAVRSP